MRATYFGVILDMAPRPYVSVGIITLSQSAHGRATEALELAEGLWNVGRW